MDPKKLQIMESASKFFSNKGYHSTSVQEIAKDCGISKGMLYKYFQSKEDLFVEILDYFQNVMFEKALDLALDKKHDKKEAFREKIIVQVDDFIEKKELIMLQFKELPADNPQLVKVLNKIKIKMMEWHKQSLLEAYGEVIEPFIWDAIMIFQGMLKEYLFMIIKEDLPITSRDLAVFIIDRMDNFIEGIQKKSSGLITDFINQNDNLSTDEATVQEKVKRIFKSMEQIINDLNINNGLKKELSEAVSTIKVEIEKKDPRSFLVTALLDYLKKEKELIRYVEKLNIYLKEAKFNGRA